MNDYLLILRGGDEGSKSLSPEEMQQHMGSYMTWVEKLTKDGVYKGGNPLHREGNVLSKDASNSVTDRPMTESKEAIGGYFMISANDLAHATETAKGCPIFKVGGTVEVRPLRAM